MAYSLGAGGKTWGEVISMIILAILYPGITMALTAQTKANAKGDYVKVKLNFGLGKAS